MSTGLRVGGVLLGIIGSLVVGMLMLIGPWTTNPPPTDAGLVASYAYPLLMLFAGGALARSARSGFWLAVLALGCGIITVTPYAMDDSVPVAESVAFGVLICMPALALSVVAWIGMRAVTRNRRPLMRR